MQKKIIFFSSQSSDNKNFKIIIPYLKNKYKIRNIENLEKVTNVLFSSKRKMINKSLKKNSKYRTNRFTW